MTPGPLSQPQVWGHQNLIQYHLLKWNGDIDHEVVPVQINSPLSLGSSSVTASLSLVLSGVLILEPLGSDVLMTGVGTGDTVAPRGREEALYSVVGGGSPSFSLRSSYDDLLVELS